MNSKITVITVVRNAEKTLEQTMLSVLNQRYSNIEYIILDGVSTDKSLDIIRKYDYIIKGGKFSNIDFIWKSEADKGIYDAMNKGIDMATGEWVNFMNAGDSFYTKHTIKDFLSLSDENSFLVYGDMQWVLSIGKYLKKASPLSIDNYMPTSHQAFFVKTALLQKMHFDVNYKICADRLFFYTAYKLGYKYQYIPLTVCNYEYEEGLSATNPLIVLSEMGQIQGINKTLKWKIQHLLSILRFRIKTIVLYLLPNKIVRNLYKKNILKRLNAI